jgi:hypothetical protein
MKGKKPHKTNEEFEQNTRKKHDGPIQSAINGRNCERGEMGKNKLRMGAQILYGVQSSFFSGTKYNSNNSIFSPKYSIERKRGPREVMTA